MLRLPDTRLLDDAATYARKAAAANRRRGIGAAVFGSLLAVAALIALVSGQVVPGLVVGAVAAYLLWSATRWSS